METIAISAEKFRQFPVDTVTRNSIQSKLPHRVCGFLKTVDVIEKQKIISLSVDG